MTSKKIIEINSPEAARQETRSVWISRHGRVFLDERAARYDGCTHRKCERCEAMCEKSWIACKKCRAECRQEVFAKMSEVKWDGKTPVCIFDTDIYFFDENEIADYCAEHECKKEDLNLILCEPVYLKELDEEYFLSDLANEDVELADQVKALIERFNKDLSAINKPVVWEPSSNRVKLDNKEMYDNTDNVTVQKGGYDS